MVKETFHRRRSRGRAVRREIRYALKDLYSALDNVKDAINDAEAQVDGEHVLDVGEDPTAPFTHLLQEFKAALEHAIGRGAEVLDLAQRVAGTPPPEGPHIPQEYD